MVVNLYIFFSLASAHAYIQIYIRAYVREYTLLWAEAVFSVHKFSIFDQSAVTTDIAGPIPFIIYFPIILIFANQSRFFFCTIFVVVMASLLHFNACALDSKKKNLTVIYSLINSKSRERTHTHTHARARSVHNFYWLNKWTSINLLIKGCENGLITKQKIPSIDLLCHQNARRCNFHTNEKKNHNINHRAACTVRSKYRDQLKQTVDGPLCSTQFK